MFGRSSLRLAVLAWTTLWFAFIVPAHHRGAIRLNEATAGTGACETAAGESCCTRKGPSQGSDRPQPAGDPVKCCAICKVVAKYGGPESGLIGPVAAAPVSELMCDRPVDRPIEMSFGSHRSRAPPVSA